MRLFNGPDVPSIFLSIDSLFRRSPSLLRVPWGRFPELIGTIAAPTPCNPSPQLVSSASDTAQPTCLICSLPGASENQVGPGDSYPGSPSGHPLTEGNRASPGSWGTPIPTCPALRPRRDLNTNAVTRSDVAFRTLGRRRLPRLPISGLSHTAYRLPVYASHLGLPQDAQDSVSAVGTLTEWGWLPTGSHKRFQLLLQLQSHPPLPGLARRTPGSSLGTRRIFEIGGASSRPSPRNRGLTDLRLPLGYVEQGDLKPPDSFSVMGR